MQRGVSSVVIASTDFVGFDPYPPTTRRATTIIGTMKFLRWKINYVFTFFLQIFDKVSIKCEGFHFSF